MIRYLLQRPIAVLLSFTMLCILGLISLNLLPVSLLPNVDVPQIVVKVNYPNIAAEALEEDIIRPIRESLLGVNGLKDIESRISDQRGILYLVFEYNTKMDLAYIEVNERIDRLSAQFPRDMPRPQTTRINTSDIPIIHLQITPKIKDDFVQISGLAENIIKRRIEQLDGVSIVDINGKQGISIEIEPRQDVLHALQIKESDISLAIQSANYDLGGLSVRDGNYRYFVKVNNGFESLADIGSIPIRATDELSFPLSKLAHIRTVLKAPNGFHLFNGHPSIGICIQKQAGARMNELVPRIRQLVKQLEKEYPQTHFSLTQDQTYLLNAGIDNLKQDLVYGGILAVLVLFLFLGNYASSTLMSINIPISLIITFALFYVFNVSLNIISMSGLALGVGMLIDNSIIVLDNITRKKNSGLNLLESCETGVQEVVTPVLSQVLTTVAVYAPLILLPGLAGLLVYDQAIALTISLGVSLLVAFILSPVLYKLFLKNQNQFTKEDTRFYLWILARYHLMVRFIFRHKFLFLIFSGIFSLSSIYFLSEIPITNLPKIEKNESLLKIDWQTSIPIEENLARIQALDIALSKIAPIREAEVGVQQYLLQTRDQTIHQAEIYYACLNQNDKEKMDREILKWLHSHYPEASVTLEDAQNAFSQLFNTKPTYFEIKLRPGNGVFTSNSLNDLNARLHSFPYRNIQLGPGAAQEQAIRLNIDVEKMALYNIDWNTLQEKLVRSFGHSPIAALQKFNSSEQLYFKAEHQKIETLLRTPVVSVYGDAIRMSTFISYQVDQTPKYITADKLGPYYSIFLNQNTPKLEEAQEKIRQWANQAGFTTRFQGTYFESRQNSAMIFKIFLLSIILLYFILALQFENLIQPILVMLTIPLGVAGALMILYLQNSSIDIMAAIGFVVVLGIIVDDPILKVEVINRLRRNYTSKGLGKREALELAIYEAGDVCLKPLLMTSLTTSLALVPVLFTPGIGSELQKPMIFVIIGGLTIGTFFTTWFIPLAYWLITKKK